MEIADWVERARQGDQAAFAQVVAEFQRPVFSLCYRMLGSRSEAEDATQEAFLRAYRALDRYDSARAFSSWLLSIAAHYCIDRLRRKRLQLVSLDALPTWRWIPGRSVDPAEAAEDLDREARVARLLQVLPEDYRVVVVLRYWHDLGYAEIAELLGDSESAIKSRLHRARRQLLEVMESESSGLVTEVERKERASAISAEGRRAPSKITESRRSRNDEGGVTWSATQPAI